MEPIRKEINTRIRFAKEQGEYWFNKIKSIQNNGNVLSSRPTRKFRQACRIYDHYIDEFTNWLNGKDRKETSETSREN